MRLRKMILAFSVAITMFLFPALSGKLIVHAENDSPLKAQIISLGGSSLSGMTSEDQEVFWYRVRMPSDGYLTLTFRSEIEEGHMTLYNSDQTKQYYTVDLADGSSSTPRTAIKTSVLNSGTYTIKIYGNAIWYGHSPYGNFSIKAEFEAAENQEGHDNINFANAYELKFGQTLTGLLTEDNDYDFYKFTVSKNESVTVTMRSELENGHITLFNGDQTKEYYSSELSDGSREMPCTLEKTVELTPGFYTIRIYGTAIYYGHTPYGKYTLRVSASEDTEKMYRLYNPYTGEHFYTANVSEQHGLVRQGWKDEGIGWIAPVDSNTPVYRLYNPYTGDHHYTVSHAEVAVMTAAGWNYEGIGWYSDDEKRVPLYRQFNPYVIVGSHNYTTSKSENNYLIGIGWREEGIGWYAVETGH